MAVFLTGAKHCDGEAVTASQLESQAAEAGRCWQRSEVENRGKTTGSTSPQPGAGRQHPTKTTKDGKSRSWIASRVSSRVKLRPVARPLCFGLFWNSWCLSPLSLISFYTNILTGVSPPVSVLALLDSILSRIHTVLISYLLNLSIPYWSFNNLIWFYVLVSWRNRSNFITPVEGNTQESFSFYLHISFKISFLQGSNSTLVSNVFWM